MPPFPERESSLLAKLKKKKALAAGIPEEEIAEPTKPVNGHSTSENETSSQPGSSEAPQPTPIASAPSLLTTNNSAGSGLLVEVFENTSSTVFGSAPTTLSPGAEDNLKK